MARYIDLDKQLVRLYLLNLTCEDVIKEFLLSADTADVVEVVRCRYCKHSVKHQLGYGCGMNYHLATNGEWFCADGERREDE